MTTTPKLVDRRKQALGGQSKDRNLQAIKRIVWHYTGVRRSLRRTIDAHERYWRDSHGWDRGGYHYYIDADGVLYHNYDLERITWGVANNNTDTVHISVEGGSVLDYTAAQIETRDWITRKLMQDLGLPGTAVYGHWEVNNNTKCPGYTKTQMDQFRKELSNTKDTRFITLPPYSEPKYPLKSLNIGDLVTIKPGHKAWYSPEHKHGITPSKDFQGQSDTIKRVRFIYIAQSKRAYLLTNLNSWILEEDLVEAWPKIPSERYLMWDGVRYGLVEGK